MGYERLFVPFMSEEIGERSLRPALELASIFDSDIEAVYVQPDSSPAHYYALQTQVVQTRKLVREWEEERERYAAELKDRFDELCTESLSTSEDASGENGIDCAWKKLVGRPQTILGHAARCCDLAVIGRPDTDNAALERDYVHSILFESGHPVFLCSRDSPHDLQAPALVAWNGSMEAARALSASLPFLQLATNAIVLTIGHVPAGAPSSEVACGYLKSHGVRADHHTVSQELGHPEQTIEEFAKREGTELLVMGAYSHSRLKEFLLGGVTKYIIESSDLTVFMAH